MVFRPATATSPVVAVPDTVVVVVCTLPAILGAAAFIVPAVTPDMAWATETVWLCKPGIAENPCESSEETTVELGDGSSYVEQAHPAANPAIDCFYVYPTVSRQETVNANLEIGAEEKQVAIDQASRFSQECKVYAPMYRQITVHALEHPEEITAGDQLTAYIGVLLAFDEYLTNYNDGRGFVLIGHSQGALVLKQLIKERIDPSAKLREQLVSAVLLGANVLVPKGETVGGDFQHIPACESASQTHCVVAYSSFLSEPPVGAYFGRVISPLLGPVTAEEEANDEVLCVNPALATQGSGSGPLLRYEATTAIPGFEFPVPSAPTPWVSMPGQYTGQCRHENGASWLQLTDVGPSEDPREKVAEVLGPLWGTHLDDVNIALGNLVGMTALQSATYEAEQLAVQIPPATPETLTPPASPSPPASSAASESPSPTRATARAAPQVACKRAVKRRRHSAHKSRLVCKHTRPAHKNKRRSHKNKYKHKRPLR
jgi:Protein of unknown function (DUF3089)